MFNALQVGIGTQEVGVETQEVETGTQEVGVETHVGYVGLIKFVKSVATQLNGLVVVTVDKIHAGS